MCELERPTPFTPTIVLYRGDDQLAKGLKVISLSSLCSGLLARVSRLPAPCDVSCYVSVRRKQRFGSVCKSRLDAGSKSGVWGVTRFSVIQEYARSTVIAHRENFKGVLEPPAEEKVDMCR